MFIEVLVVFAGLSDNNMRRIFCGLGGFDCGRVFVVGRNMGGCGVCLKWYETFDARALRCSLRRGFIDEGVE